MKRIILIAALAIAFIGCNKEEPVQPANNSGGSSAPNTESTVEIAFTGSPVDGYCLVTDIDGSSNGTTIYNCVGLTKTFNIDEVYHITVNIYDGPGGTMGSLVYEADIKFEDSQTDGGFVEVAKYGGGLDAYWETVQCGTPKLLIY